jgi:hypothetical protein
MFSLCFPALNEVFPLLFKLFSFVEFHRESFYSSEILLSLSNDVFNKSRKKNPNFLWNPKRYETEKANLRNGTKLEASWYLIE